MKKKIYSIIIIGMLLSLYFVIFSNTGSSLESSTENDWYYLPAYPNYSPNGLPDFSQVQQKDWWGPKYPDCCGAVALADIIWWFDSKHEDPNGFPGDGHDNYSLISNYNYLDNPIPGPNYDDHSFNNVNDNRTAWNRFRRGGELIEQIMWHTYRQKDAIWFRFFGPFGGIYTQFKLYLGTLRWLKDSGLQNQYSVKLIFKPDFSFINECVRNNQGVMLSVGGYDPEVKPFGIFWGHCLAVAGINSSGEIAFSDPVRDRINPSSDPAEHNNASIVSHDIYKVNLTSPWPRISSWWIPEYCKEGIQVIYAIVISEIN
jgi:hypothetical protein